MDGLNGGATATAPAPAPAPFVTKTYEMVEDPSTNSIVGWSNSGRSFIVCDPMAFSRDLLPQYFKHNNFSSFVRQLNTYGFKKIDPEQWEFANEEFLRGQRHLLKNIYRRKPIYSHSTHGNAALPLCDQERHEFQEEIRRMKHENRLLQSELEKRKHENHEFASEMGTLGKFVKNIDHRQRQLITFLAQALRKPGFNSVLLQQNLDNNHKRRRLSVSNDVSNKEERQLVTCKELDLDLIDELESSINYMESFMFGICESISTEKAEVLGDPNVHIPPPCFSTSRDSSTSREIDPSPINTCPVIILDSDAPKEQLLGKQTTPVSICGGTNDVFWQQFFTETPRFTVTQEAQSERRGTESRFTDFGKHWWKNTNLNSPVKQMGHHLTPVGKTSMM